jgi:hypothetical protein
VIPRAFPDAQPALDVQAECRLVEEQDLGIWEQSAGDVELALHAARVGLGRLVGPVFEVHQFEQFGNAALRFVFRQVVEIGQQQ